MPRLFGGKLKVLRHISALTQTELAHRIGLESHSHITKLEHGEAPSLDVAVRIARLFAVPLDLLLRDSIPLEMVDELSKSRDVVLTVEADDQQHVPLDFGERLRSLRLQHQFSQRDLARQLGFTSRSYISSLEAGTKLVSIESLLKLADLYMISAEDLIWGISHRREI